MNFTKESIQQGRANQDASVETPESFATLDGAAVPREGTELSKGNSRMAGEIVDECVQLAREAIK